MDCKEFLSSYTDYRDGLLSDGEGARAEVHLSGCASCRRYTEVVSKGVRELRSLPSVSTTDDFRPRLQHRIYHVADGDDFFGDSSRGSGTTAVAAVGIAILLTAAAWSPVLRQAGETITLPALVVNGPPRSSVRAEVQLPPSAFFRDDDSWRRAASPRWSPPTNLWTSAGASSSAAGIRVSSSGGAVRHLRTTSSSSLDAGSTAVARLLDPSGASFSYSSSRPVFFNAATSTLGTGTGVESSSLGLD